MKKLPPLSKAAKELKRGIYSHYKTQNQYLVIGVGRDEATLREVVIYEAMYGDSDIWVRPLEVFLEKVEHNGQLVPRFTLVEPV